jgi:hypothetical protein
MSCAAKKTGSGTSFQTPGGFTLTEVTVHSGQPHASLGKDLNPFKKR